MANQLSLSHLEHCMYETLDIGEILRIALENFLTTVGPATWAIYLRNQYDDWELSAFVKNNMSEAFLDNIPNQYPSIFTHTQDQICDNFGFGITTAIKPIINEDAVCTLLMCRSVSFMHKSNYLRDAAYILARHINRVTRVHFRCKSLFNKE